MPKINVVQLCIKNAHPTYMGKAFIRAFID